MITSYTDHTQNIVVHYDTDAEPAKRFIVWVEGNDRHVVAEDGEFPGATWERVLATVQDMRRTLAEAQQRDPGWKHPAFVRGNPYRQAHVYAGVEPTREQVASHMKQWIIWSLWQLACPQRNDRAMERIAALGALAELYGLHQPQTVRVKLPTLEQIEAELARRMVQQ